MKALVLQEFHQQHGAQFADLNGQQRVAHYGDWHQEYSALKQTAGVLDLGFRSRLCLLGSDRVKFLHGQVTQDVKALAVGQGAYAALITAKGKLQSDLFIYCLTDELLLDFEPGLADSVRERLEKYVIADDVQVVDVSEPYGHLSVQGPRAREVLEGLQLGTPLPLESNRFSQTTHSALGELYVMNRPRLGSSGFDLFVPSASLLPMAEELQRSVGRIGGRLAGWDACECARIEATIPRFGVDMDETNLPPEAGLDTCAISYAKGCYIGQEVMARLRTYGQVAKALRGLLLPAEAQVLPKKGDKIYWGDKEIGYVTSSTASPTLKTNVALAYLRRDRNQLGSEVQIQVGQERVTARVASLPFSPLDRPA